MKTLVTLPNGEMKWVDSDEKLIEKVYSKTMMDGNELIEFEEDEDNWIIPGLLPVGLTILAGDPKAGKSRLARSMALDLSLGRPVFGKFEPKEPGTIVYIPLEERTSAIKKQLVRMCNNRSLPTDDYLHQLLFFKVTTPEANLLDIEDLFYFIEDNYTELSNPLLFVCDPLGKIMAWEGYDENRFFANYTLFGPVQDLALELNIAVVLIHHLRKSNSNSPLKRMLGSVALAACGASGWVLSRSFNSTKGTLQISAKEMEDRTYELNFNRDTLEWDYVGDVFDLGLTADRQKIVDLFLNNSNVKMKSGDIAVAVGKADKTTSVSSLCSALTKDGILVSPKYGIYKLKDEIYSQLKKGYEEGGE
jgi:RecA-family ATPase